MRLDSVRNEEIADVDVAGLLSRRLPTVLQQTNLTLIVLLKDGTLVLVALAFEIHLNPDNAGQVVAGTNELGLSGTLRVQVLLVCRSRVASKSFT